MREANPTMPTSTHGTRRPSRPRVRSDSIPNSGWAMSPPTAATAPVTPSSATLLSGSSSAMRLGTSELATPPFAMFTNSCTPTKPTMRRAEPLDVRMATPVDPVDMSVTVVPFQAWRSVAAGSFSRVLTVSNTMVERSISSYAGHPGSPSRA